MSFRSTTAAEYTFYVMPGAVESDVYTTIYLTVKNAKDELCYSDAYKDYSVFAISRRGTGDTAGMPKKLTSPGSLRNKEESRELYGKKIQNHGRQ